MNEEAEQLRARAARYERLAKDVTDKQAARAIEDLADEYRARADALGRAETPPKT